MLEISYTYAYTVFTKTVLFQVPEYFTGYIFLALVANSSQLNMVLLITQDSNGDVQFFYLKILNGIRLLLLTLNYREEIFTNILPCHVNSLSFESLIEKRKTKLIQCTRPLNLDCADCP